MTLSTVTLRQAVAAIAATLLTLFAVIVVVRSDGLPAVDAASARATAWFVHQPTGRVVLVDGYGGRALASLDAATPGEQLSVAEGRPGAFVLNDTTAEARAIDSVELRLGTPFGLSALGAGTSAVRGRTGRFGGRESGRRRGRCRPGRGGADFLPGASRHRHSGGSRRFDLVAGRRRSRAHDVDDHPGRSPGCRCRCTAVAGGQRAARRRRVGPSSPFR